MFGKSGAHLPPCDISKYLEEKNGIMLSPQSKFGRFWVVLPLQGFKHKRHSFDLLAEIFFKQICWGWIAKQGKWQQYFRSAE